LFGMSKGKYLTEAYPYSFAVAPQKTVVVTGCSTGIGEDVTKLLANKGWVVFAGVRKQTDAERLRSLSTNIRPLILDVTKQDQVDAAFEQVRTAVGEDGLDALVNNAGLAIMGPSEFWPVEEFKAQYEINVFGLVRVTQAAMPLLRMGKPGRVVNVSSLAPTMNMPFGGLYCATKAAVDSFSECFRREVMQWGIKVSVVKPGPVKTNFGDRMLDLAGDVKKKFGEDSKCIEYYGHSLERFPNIMKKLESQMAHVSATTSVIYHALTSRSPRYFYHDTWGTYITHIMIDWMPTFIYDKIITAIIS